MKSFTKIPMILFVVFVLAGGIPTILFGQEQDKQAEDQSASKLSELSLGDLLNMQVITVSKQAESSSDAPGIISVLTKDELERFGGTTLKDMLERVPGLIGSTVYMTDRSIVSVRGDQVQPSSGHVLLLINGRPVRESLEGGIKSEVYESFPVNIIEKIEVIKGPGSVLYGSNAFSGVINVITQKAQRTGFSIEGLAGNGGAYGTMASATIESGDLNIVAAGRYFKKADWDVNYKYFNPISGSVDTYTYTIPNKGPGIFLDANYKDLRLMFSYTMWETYYSVTDYAFVFPAYGTSSWKKYFGDLGYDITVNDKWNMTLHGTYTKSMFEVSSWPGSHRDSYEALGEWTNFFNPTENLRITVGGLYNYFQGVERTVSAASIDTITNNHRYSFGIYTQLDYRISEQLKLTGGIQANKVQNIDMNFVPRVGVIWSPVESVNIKTLYSEAFRAPSINELEINFAAMKGNPNLQPERVKTVDVGMSYTGEQVYVGFGGFYSKMNNIIYQDRSGPVPTYMNIGEVTIKGFELEAKYYVNREIFLTASMLSQSSEDKAGNKHVTPIASFGAKAGVSYKSENGITVSLFNIYQGDLDKNYETQLNVSPGAYDIVNLYCRADLNKLFNLSLGKELAFIVQVDNLLDKDLWLPNWGLAPGTSIPYDQGRAVYFGLNVGF